MATTETVSQTEDREETQALATLGLGRERKALRSSPADDSLRRRLLGLLGGNMYTELNGTPGVSYERALFRYAAATTKAVALALKGHDYVSANEPYETAFTDDEAATVLCGLSALLEQGPDLVDDVRCADPEVRS